jgi:hypothetical protein
MATNAQVVDELIVKLTLQDKAYVEADKRVDAHVTKTEKKRQNEDNKRKQRDKDNIKRLKQQEAAVKQFTGALSKMALTVGTVLGVGAGVSGIIGAMVSLAGFETNLRRAAVSTGMSNRELQAWGSTARRMGADASAGAQAIADLAREQKQFNLTGSGPTMQALARAGVMVGPGVAPEAILAQAQQVYRQSTPAQQQQMEAQLAAQGVSQDLIVMIKSETDARDAYTRSLNEASEENKKALAAVSSAMSTVENAAVGVASALTQLFQPAVESFAQWSSDAAAALSDFNDDVQNAGGGLSGFSRALETRSPELAKALDALGSGLRVAGEAVDIVAYGLQQLWGALKSAFNWLDSKLAGLLGTSAHPLKDAVGTVGDAISWAWKGMLGDARRYGPSPVGGLIGDRGEGAALTPGARAALAAQERSERRQAREMGLGPGESIMSVGAGTPGARALNAGSAQNLMQRLIVGYGLSVPQAAAVAANMQRESGLNPAAFNAEGGGQGARGLAQWRGPRIDAFRAKYGVAPDQATIDQQIAFMMTDPYEQSLMRKAFAGGGDAETLGRRFSRIYEGHGKVAEDLKRGSVAAQLAGNANPSADAANAGPAIGNQINIQSVTVQANDPNGFVSGIRRVSGVQNYTTAVR